MDNNKLDFTNTAVRQLSGANARANLVIGIFHDIINNPDYYPSGADYDYLTADHEKLLAIMEEYRKCQNDRIEAAQAQHA